MYGSRLKYYINRSGMTQQYVANQAEIPESSLSNFIRQEYPPLDAVVKVCAALDVPLNVFFSDPENTKNIALDEKEYKLLSLFKKLPIELQTDAIIQLNVFVNAWIAGRKGNGSGKSKK